MRKTIIILGVVLLLGGTLLVNAISLVQDNIEDVVETKDNIIRDTILGLGDFDTIDIDRVINVFITQGTENIVVLEAEQKLADKITISTKGKTLKIRGLKNIDKLNKFKSPTLYLTVNELKYIYSNGVGNIKSQNTMKLGSLNIDNFGVGNVKLIVDATKISLRNSGVGNVYLSGETKELIIKNSGVGNVKAYKCKVEKAEVDNSGVGGIKVFATKELSIKTSGIGSVKYKGDAIIKKIDISGIGRVKKER